ncbi:hypothetical protein [Tautonia plasticadhaerens]|uniref:Uncharacterized protein n=1 Tax=Tautonia plasticadhaerens TaxID=2527974 RepID=A0A518H423_9BACT|nr:hypothetical protein [Tautonia plasticadhaerens]QDV35567.1 hypothetical protein ElP_34710 [Tautonia plasticadhaerens]
MDSFRPRLQEARSAGARMDALCEFSEFWLGPRRSDYGESARALGVFSLQMPLKRLYEFAGRWPHRDHRGSIQYTVPALSHQDSLMALHRLKRTEDRKIVFLQENQGVWDCRTLPEGDDPPVWCYGNQFDEHGNDFTGERVVCESLSRFLVTFVMQELTFGSRLYLSDEGLGARFASERDAAVPVWTNGLYVGGAVQDYYLWRGVLVANLFGDGKPLAANHEGGIRFLTENQGPVHEIALRMDRHWSLDIRSDGSARIRYLEWQTDESAEAPAGTFEFPALSQPSPQQGRMRATMRRTPWCSSTGKVNRERSGAITCMTAGSSRPCSDVPSNGRPSRIRLSNGCLKPSGISEYLDLVIRT